MKILTTLILILTCASNGFASPLIFKVLKEINSKDEYVEVASIDAGKYRQIRIGVSVLGDDASIPNEVVFQAQDDGSLINIQNLNLPKAYSSVSEIIDSPPAKLRIAVKGKGSFKLLIWGSV